MKVYLVCVLFILAICTLFGCSNNVPEDITQEPQSDETTVETPEERSDDVVNLKCSNAMLQTFYFLGEDVKIEAIGKERESWVLDGWHYMKMEFSDGVFLVKQKPPEDIKMTIEAVNVAYKTSKKYEGLDCEVGVVTEDDVKLIDLPIITNEEMGQKMLNEMMKGVN